MRSSDISASPERRRLLLALQFSLLGHALLLMLTFGGQGFGLPGLGLPWQQRRAEAPDLRVVLAQTRAAVAPQAPLPADPPARMAAPLPTAAVDIVAETRPPLTTLAAPASPIAALASLAPLPDAGVAARPSPDVARAALPPLPEVAALAPAETLRTPAPVPLPTPIAVTTPSASSPQLAQAPRDPADAARARLHREAPTAEALELERARRAAQIAQLEAARQEQLRQDAARADAERREAARQEAARAEAARLQQEAARQEQLRQDAARADAERREAARQDQARAEAARQQQEAARQEQLRQDAARAEAERREAARQEQARAEAARQQQEAARQDQARAEAARQDAARAEVAKAEAARLDVVRQEAARQDAARLEAALAAEQREARLRAIGRQLDEEAARRANPSASSLRRGRLFGRSDANVEMVLYAEAWSRKIELNQTFDMIRDAVKQPHTDPLVTVAIRSDGSVESVSFVRSSGVPAIDEAIRRIVQSQANYPAFQPALAREYDVVEIRRSWHFDTAIRLY